MQFDPEIAPTLGPIEHFNLYRFPTLKGGTDFVETCAISVWALQHSWRLTNRFCCGIPGHAREALVHIDDARPRSINWLRFGNENDVTRIVQNRFQET